MLRVFNCISSQHDWPLVVLAGAICFLTCIAAVNLFHRARAAKGHSRGVWIVTAGCAAGVGIWATHFIGILAFNPPIPIAYGVLLTAVSLVVAIAVVTVGLGVAVYGGRRWSASAGGVVVGLGVAVMHYLGMAALEMSGTIIWSTDLVAMSVLIGVIFAAGALEVLSRSVRSRGLIAGAALLTLSIVSMHFIGMGAVGIIPDAINRVTPSSFSDTSLSLAVAAVTASVLAMCIAGAWSDRRMKDKLDEQNRLLDGALNNMSQGLCMFDADSRLVVWNQRYLDMYSVDPSRVRRGSTVRDLLDARLAAGSFPLDPASYEKDLSTSLKEGKAFARNVELSDGRIIAVVNQPMAAGGWVATHDDITVKQKAERELEHTRAFLDTIIENVPSPIIVKSVPNLRCLLVNRAAEAVLGVDRNAILGKRTAEIMPEGAADAIEAEDRKAIASDRPVFFDEHTIVTPGNGPRVVTSTRLSVTGPDGNSRYLITMIRDRTVRKQHEARIAHLAHHDPLTELPNRAAFNECLAGMFEQAQFSENGFAVLSADLDRFKEINDVFGGLIGDELLGKVAHRLQDACEGAFLARVGGDEFAMITPFGPQPATAAALVDRVVSAFASELEVKGQSLKVGLTIGAAVFPTDGVDAASLVANADAALHRAKNESRGSIRFFEISMDKQLREKRVLQQDLRTAIMRDELELYYQPQAKIGGGVTGFEALVRWHHPRLGLIPPSKFIPLAEESGMIWALGQWILRTACREAAAWPRPLGIAVNLSPAQFHNGDLTNFVHETLLATGLPASRLELEITEGVLIGDFSRAVATLRRLKSFGVRIAMDDFGTGYSSLSYLQSFPFDKIKIDQAFVANLGHREQSAAIIRAVIGLGRGLNLPVLAEGVETEEQRAFLAAESCDEIQGFLVGKPQPIEFYAEAVGRMAKKKKKAPIARAS
ncbi:MAG TPA: EAL domain-containing protein [Pseudolabrys sp.]|nr:EAL domain-containing protein [Pseudolabrys sp.]